MARTRLLAIVAVLFGVLCTVSSSVACEGPVAPAEVSRLSEAAVESYLTEPSGDRTLREALARVARSTPCLSGPVESRSWARMLYHVGVLEYADRTAAWRHAVLAALQAEPGLDRTGPPAVKELSFDPRRPRFVVLPEVDVDRLRVDGRVPVDGFTLYANHVLQIRHGDRWESTWVSGRKLPESWVEMVQRGRGGPPGKALLRDGGIVAGTGAVVALVAIAAGLGTNVERGTPAHIGLTTMELTGWGTTAAGGGMLIAGLVRRSKGR